MFCSSFRRNFGALALVPTLQSTGDLFKIREGIVQSRIRIAGLKKDLRATNLALMPGRLRVFNIETPDNVKLEVVLEEIKSPFSGNLQILI